MVTIAATLIGVGAAAATSAALAKFKSKEIVDSVHHMQAWVSHLGSEDSSPYRYIPVQDKLSSEGITSIYQNKKATLKLNRKELAVLEKNYEDLMSSCHLSDVARQVDTTNEESIESLEILFGVGPVLDLQNANKTVKDIKTISKALANNKNLTALNLTGNEVLEEGAEYLSRCLTYNSTLVSINLSNCSLGDRGARLILRSMHLHPSIQRLMLNENNITAEGISDIDQVMDENKVTQLGLRGNQLGDVGAEILANWLRDNLTVTTLDLGSNGFAAVGAAAIGDALRTNKRLTALSLAGNDGIEESGARKIAENLSYNRTITFLELDGKGILPQTREILERHKLQNQRGSHTIWLPWVVFQEWDTVSKHILSHPSDVLFIEHKFEMLLDNVFLPGNSYASQMESFVADWKKNYRIDWDIKEMRAQWDHFVTTTQYKFLHQIHNHIRKQKMDAESTEKAENAIMVASDKFPSIVNNLLFNRLYSLVFDLYRHKYRGEDEKRAILCGAFMNGMTPWLESRYWNSERPFSAAIRILQSMTNARTPQDKTDVLHRTIENVLKAIDPSLHHHLGEEQMVPIKIYVSVKANVPNIYSEFQFINDFHPETMSSNWNANLIVTFGAIIENLPSFLELSNVLKLQAEYPPSKEEKRERSGSSAATQQLDRMM